MICAKQNQIVIRILYRIAVPEMILNMFLRFLFLLEIQFIIIYYKHRCSISSKYEEFIEVSSWENFHARLKAEEEGCDALPDGERSG